jgi:phosphatidylinositol 4-kinase A
MRRDKIAEEAAKIAIPREDLYLPVDVHKRLAGIIPTSGRAMQSAAKTPIMLAFEVENLPVHSHEVKSYGGSLVKQALIFKVGDDCRQDVLALQIITILRNAYKRAGIPLYLFPYGVLPTGYERGIIEVVPNAKSRAGLGEMTDAGLYEIFQSRYGAPGTPAFEAARRAFVLSEAGYAIASYLLQSKDRHNGNIMFDDDGRLIHIDFGFIFEISPGGNLGFEDAAFKFSHEMAQLIDPGGQRASTQYVEFKELCVKGFLAARAVAEEIIAIAALMAQSGLPCYSRGKPLENLRGRFMLGKTPEEAAAFMRGAVDMAHTRWRTSFYDYIQVLQNDIPF